jgi:exopolysaccharide production protein ExoZ
MTVKSGRFFGLEAARGIAAALVAVNHAADMTAQERYYGLVPFGGGARNFSAGVDFFFVLSGFIITWVHFADIGRKDRLGPYLWRRFLRIYPLYWAVLLPLIVLYTAFPSLGLPAQREISNIVPSFFLLPGPEAPVLGVAWTLVFEITFYAAFSCLIFFGRPAFLALFAWVGAILLANAFFQPLNYPAAFFFNPRILEFCVGMAIARYLRDRTVPVPMLLLLLGLAGFVAGLALLDPTSPISDLIFTAVFGSSAAAMVLGLVELDRAGQLPRLRLFAEMGACSYAIYLVHVVAESFSARPVMLVRHSVSVEVATLLLAAAGVAGGVAVHYLVEPYVNALARRLGRAFALGGDKASREKSA